MTLRVLAFCLLADEALAPAPGGISDGDAPDLLARDPTGQMLLWVRCGGADPVMVRKAIQHNPHTVAHVVFGRPERHDAFADEVRSWTVLPRGWERVSLWSIDRALVQALAAREDTRQRWTVTFVGDQLYVDNGHGTFDGPVLRG